MWGIVKEAVKSLIQLYVSVFMTYPFPAAILTVLFILIFFVWQWLYKRLGIEPDEFWKKPQFILCVAWLIITPIVGRFTRSRPPDRQSPVHVEVNVQDSPDAKVQTAVNSPNATQILIEDLTINPSPQLERKLTMNPVYVNKPQDDKYVTLLRGRLKAPYPVPNLRVEAHGDTVEEIEFTGTGIYVLSDRGKREGYVFATWQDAIGNLELKIVSRQPGKLHIRFAVQE